MPIIMMAYARELIVNLIRKINFTFKKKNLIF